MVFKKILACGPGAKKGSGRRDKGERRRKRQSKIPSPLATWAKNIANGLGYAYLKD